MEERTARLERELEQLSQAVKTLCDRVAALEAQEPLPTALAPVARLAASEALTTAALPSSRPGWSAAALAGRSFIALGGAFLLRALAQVSQAGGGDAAIEGWGVALGMLYASVWLFLANRAARAGRAVDACAHGAVASAIAFPLIWESTTRFRLLDPTPAAGAVILFGLALLAIAVRRGLPLLAWLGASAAIATAAGLWLAERGPWALLAAVLALSAAALGVAAWKGWSGLRWPIAAILNIQGLLALVLGGRRNWEALEATAVTVLVLAIAALFLTSFAASTLVRRAQVGPFEVLQSLVLVGLSYGGACLELRESAAAQAALAATVLGLGLFCLTAALLIFERRDQGVNVAVFTLFGAALLGEGLRSLLPPETAAMVFGALALCGAWLAAEERRWALRLGSVGLALAGAIGSGLLVSSLRAFFEPDPSPSSFAAWVVLALLCLAYVALRRRTSGALSSAAVAFVMLALVTIGAVGAAALAMGRLVAPTDLGELAVARTAALTAAAVLLAFLARRYGRMELVWASYAALGLAVIKIPADDLRHGRPATMFLTLALFGGALIAAPWLIRRTSRGPS
jgi:hypothetical protein